jgi:hypothetical protein
MRVEVDNPYCSVMWIPKFREYGLQDKNSTSYLPMHYCFNCGTALPESLRNLWFDILEKEYGLESPLGNDKKKVPAEFQTDEWWKKKGL